MVITGLLDLAAEKRMAILHTPRYTINTKMGILTAPAPMYAEEYAESSENSNPVPYGVLSLDLGVNTITGEFGFNAIDAFTATVARTHQIVTVILKRYEPKDPGFFSVIEVHAGAPNPTYVNFLGEVDRLDQFVSVDILEFLGITPNPGQPVGFAIFDIQAQTIVNYELEISVRGLLYH
jgi:hypothetical protein